MIRKHSQFIYYPITPGWISVLTASVTRHTLPYQPSYICLNLSSPLLHEVTLALPGQACWLSAQCLLPHKTQWKLRSAKEPLPLRSAPPYHHAGPTPQDSPATSLPPEETETWLIITHSSLVSLLSAIFQAWQSRRAAFEQN